MQSYWLEEESAFLRFLDLPGRGPACVFLHGLGAASSADFPETVRLEPLRTRRALLVDLLGFGYSDRPPIFDYSLDHHADAVARLLDHLSTRGCIVVGHSMGGAVAVSLAALRPDLVGCLILAEGNLDPGGGVVSRPIAAQTESEFVARGHRAFVDLLHAQPPWASYAATVRAADPVALHRTATELVRGSSPTMRERLVAASMPRTYIFGERSLPDPDHDRLPSHGVEVAVVPAAGHAMMSDNAPGFAGAIGAAIDRAQLE